MKVALGDCAVGSAIVGLSEIAPGASFDTGRRAGDEVAQLYVHAVASSVVRPVKELRGFQRLTLQPGEKRTITFTVPAAKLAFWDEKTHAFLVEPGAFELSVGASSADIRAKAVLEVTL